MRSRELDVGLWWREEAQGPLYRAAWVNDTGELYVVRLGPTPDGGGHVEVLATVSARERLESMLEGWREQCGRPRSLQWLRERAGRLGDRVRVAQLRALAVVAATGAALTATTALTLGLGQPQPVLLPQEEHV
jgi:hypothetical protein